jgi:site-specific DNA recombinase
VRRVKVLEHARVERTDERLRIVSNESWQRAKARQARNRSAAPAMMVRGTVRKGGGGKPGKYAFTGLLACEVCGASFVLRNRESHSCASHWHGGACSNMINVSKSIVQDIMLDAIREDLSDPAVLDEFERRFRAAMRRTRQPPKADNGKRRTQVRKEIANLTDAIASGALRGSPALAERLQAAESELASLEEQRAVKRWTTALLVPDVRGRYLDIVKRLDGVLTRDPERGRDILGEKIKLRPDKSGTFLWAEYSLGLSALLPRQSNADIVVAGAGFRFRLPLSDYL